MFSVPSGTRFPTLKNRAVVEHIGDDTGNGKWKCNRDAAAISCSHIISARHCLQQHVQGNWNAQDLTVAGQEHSKEVCFGMYYQDFYL